MQIHYQFIAAAVIALIAGVGSVSGNELYAADAAGDPGAFFAVLKGIAPEQISVKEMAAIRGAGHSSVGSDIRVLVLTTSAGDTVAALDKNNFLIEQSHRTQVP